jgi:hypothetical protein
MEVGTEVIVNERVSGPDRRRELIGEAGIISGIHKFEHADTLYAVKFHHRKFLVPIYFYKEELSVMNGDTDEEYDEGVSTDTIISELLGGAL